MKLLKSLKPKDWLTISTGIFLLIIIAGAFLRFYRLEAFVTFLGDQGRDAIIIKRLATLEHLPFIGPPSSIGQVFLGPFFYYIMAPFLLLFNFQPVGLAFGVSFLSLVGIAAIYFIIRHEINTVTALFFTILVAFSSVNIELARFAWNPNLLPVTAFFTLYFCYKTLSSKKIWYPFLFGVFFSISFQLHHLSLLMGLPIFITFVVETWRSKQYKELIKKVVVAIGAFCLGSSQLILFDLKNKFLNTNNLINTFAKGELVSQGVPLPLNERIINAATSLLQHSLKIELSSFVGIILWISLFIICIYIYKRTTHRLIKLHILNLFLFTTAFGLLSSPRHPHYYGTVYYSLLIIFAYIFSLLQDNKYIKFTLVPLLIAGYISLNATGYYFFYNKPNNQIRDAEKIADSIIPLIKKTPYQIVPLPIAVTDGHIRYFLETKNHRPLDYDSALEGEELFVLCFYNNPCEIIGNSQWQIAAFKNPKIDKIVKLELVTIYKLVHEPKS